MNPFRRYLLVLPLTGLLIANVPAESEYKTPNNLTIDDKKMMLSGKADYQSCLRENMSKYEDKVGDPRALVDIAMTTCEETLTAFDQKLQENDLHPDYRQYYVDRVRKDSASEALRQALFIFSQRQNAPAATPEKGGE